MESNTESRLVQGESFLRGRPAAFIWGLGIWAMGTTLPKGVFCPQDIIVEVLLGPRPMGSQSRVPELPPLTTVPHEQCDLKQITSLYQGVPHREWGSCRLP